MLCNLIQCLVYPAYEMISVIFAVLSCNVTDNYCTSGINKPAWQQELSVCTRSLLKQLARENRHGLHCEDSGVPRCDVCHWASDSRHSVGS